LIFFEQGGKIYCYESNFNPAMNKEKGKYQTKDEVTINNISYSIDVPEKIVGSNWSMAH